MESKRFDSILKKYFWPMAAIVFVLPAVLVVFFLVLPLQEKYAAIGLEFKDKQSLLAKKQGEAKDFQESRGKIADLPANDLKKLQELLPAEKGVENLLQILEDMAKDNGFALKNAAFNEVSEKEAATSSFSRVKILKVAANFSGGDYPAFKKLLISLEQSARLIDPASLNFTVKADNYAVNMNTYWLGDLGNVITRLDDKFFANPAFQALKSAQVELKPEPRGNENPFK
ncbi:MAG: hypothetical protein Q8M83_04630 [bacterium]|nr:hypothetical protein [bacterium]